MVLLFDAKQNAGCSPDIKQKGAGDVPIPDEINQVAAIGPGGLIGWLAAVAMGGVFAFRKIWHSDRIMTANTNGAVDTIQRLYDLLDKERANNARLQELLQEANERTDQANRERNEVIRELGDIKAQLAALQAEVRMLRGVHDGQ